MRLKKEWKWIVIPVLALLCFRIAGPTTAVAQDDDPTAFVAAIQGSWDGYVGGGLVNCRLTVSMDENGKAIVSMFSRYGTFTVYDVSVSHSVLRCKAYFDDNTNPQTDEHYILALNNQGDLAGSWSHGWSEKGAAVMRAAGQQVGTPGLSPITFKRTQ
jgi:hypothetical protein